jgi:hypothetical protein
MTPESRDNPLLDNGSLTYVSMEMLIRGGLICTELAFHANGIDKSFPGYEEADNNFHGYEQAANSFHGDQRLYSYTYSSFVRQLSVQLWSVNQRATEAEEVTDS